MMQGLVINKYRKTKFDLVTDEEIDEIREEMEDEIKEEFSMEEKMPKRWVAFGPTSYSQSILQCTSEFKSSSFSSAHRRKNQVYKRKRHSIWICVLGWRNSKRLEMHEDRG